VQGELPASYLRPGDVDATVGNRVSPDGTTQLSDFNDADFSFPFGPKMQVAAGWFRIEALWKPTF